MNTLEELRDEFISVIQDTNFTEDWIDARINECLKLCSEKVLLPKLESSGTFSTVVGTPYAAIPTSWSYGRNLYKAEVDSAPEIKVLSSLGLLAREYPDAETELETGNIEFIAEVGSQLFYYPIPAEITVVKCSFYITPTVLTADTDTITYIPENQLEDIILSYLKWKAYNKIEDGAEGGEGGGKPNTATSRKEFWTAIGILDESFPVGQSWPDYHRPNGWI